MEAADNIWTPWDDDFGSWSDQAHETVGGDPTPDAMPQSQYLTDAQLDDFTAELWNPTGDFDPGYDSPDPDGIVNPYPQIEPSPTMEPTSPSSSGGIIHTPFSEDFDFISSPGPYQTPHMSPNSLMESPQACFAGPDKLTPDHLNISPFTREGFAPGAPSMAPLSATFDFNSPPGFCQGPYLSPSSLMGSPPQGYFPGPSQLMPGQTNISPYTREGVAPEAPSMAPNRASRKRPRRVKSSPPGMKASGMKARAWRKINKPELCPACPLHFPYQSELDKHLIARHPQIAVEQGLSLDRHVCGWCLKEYARKDGLMRHLTNKHQRQKTWKKRPQN